ncbi:hypothetical protein LCM28_05650 [Salipiger pacificus]|nr:hypothetical protein [Alloyangia pacifica]
MLFSILQATGTGRLLTKSFRVGNDGTIEKDAAQTGVGKGLLRRTTAATLHDLNRVMQQLEPNQCITTGTYIGDPKLEHDGVVKIAAEAQLEEGEVTRSKKNVGYRPGEPAILFLDFDFGGVPEALIRRFERECGGSIVTLIESLGLPQFIGAGWLIRGSASAGVSTADGEQRLDSRNQHGYGVMEDGAHMDVVVTTLKYRMLREGWGFASVTASGAIRVKTILDIGSSDPNRIIFEADPALHDGLVRPPTQFEVIDGKLIQSSSITPVTPFEYNDMKVIEGKLRAPLREAAAEQRALWQAQKVEKMVADGTSEETARAHVAQLERRTLIGSHMVKLDNGEELPVIDIIRDWRKYAGARAYCPMEPEKGRTRAIIYGEDLDDDDVPYLARIRSFMAGGTIFKLALDRVTLIDALKRYKTGTEASEDISHLLLYYDGNFDKIEDDLKDEIEKFLGDTCNLPNAGNVAKQAVRDANKTRAEMKMRASRAAFAKAASETGRDMLDDPDPKDPHTRFGTQVAECVKERRSPHPIMVDISGNPVTVHRDVTYSKLTDKHTTSYSVIGINQTAFAVHLERHFSFAKVEKGALREVSLNPSVNAHLFSDARAWFPTMSSLVQHPIMRNDGSVYTPIGYDWDTRLYGACDVDIDINGPAPSVTEVFKSTDFLLNTMCCDVLFKSDQDRMVFLALLCTALTVKQIKLVPGYLINANSVSVGKTTLARLISYAVLGHDLPMISWPNDRNPEVEGEKRIIGQMFYSPLLIGIDNLKRGEVFSSSVLEGIITAEKVLGRRLGSSDMTDVDASVIPVLTGNEVSLSEDTASRFLTINLDSNMVNPELRELRRKDVIGWVEKHRKEILTHAYTIMRFRLSKEYEEQKPQSRFPIWNDIVAGPVMNAFSIWRDTRRARPLDHNLAHYPDSDPSTNLSFGKAFLQGKEMDLEKSSMSDVIHAMYAAFGEEPFPLKMIGEMVDMEHGNQNNAAFRYPRSANFPDGYDLENMRTWDGINTIIDGRYRDMSGLDDSKPINMRSMSKRFTSHTEVVGFETIEKNRQGEWCKVKIEAKLTNHNVQHREYRKTFKVDVVSRKFEGIDND